MDTVLMAVTALSLAMAAGMAFIVAKLVRAERARSEARVAALGAMSADPVVDVPLPRPAAVPRRQIVVAPAVPASQRLEHAALSEDDFEIRPSDGGVSGVSTLFAETEQASPWGRRFAVIGSFALVLLLMIGFATMSGRGRPSASAAPGTSVAQHAPALDTPPLELLSLHHAQETERFVISGLVKNPGTGTPLSRVVATAFLFGPDGTFLTSGRAALDFTNLTPGVESPFVVNVPVTGQVARYRVGFRTEDGRVIAHVDKRGPDALAQK
jgi:hypothetical protein